RQADTAARRVGRFDHPVHPQRQVRAERPQGLRQQRADRDGFCHRGAGRHRRNHRAVQVSLLRSAAGRSICLAMKPQTAIKQAPRDFSSVETWVFDLDNTLYPHDLNLWQQIDDRIREYVSNYLKVSKEDAFRVQKDFYKRHGTTMHGLMIEHGMRPDDYLEFVHKIDHSP